MGPQGDIRRLYNYARCVREGAAAEIFTGGKPDNSAFNQVQPSGGQNPGDQTLLGGTQNEGRPEIDLTSAASQLGVTVQELQDALGPPPPNLSAAAASLGVPEQVVIEALGLPGGGPPPPPDTTKCLSPL